MEKNSYGKWGGWIAPVGVLLRLFAVITAQPGFLSISCGGKTNHTSAEINITWVTDDDYIDVGKSVDTGDSSHEAYGSYLHSLRVFPKPLNKPCYQLAVEPHVPHLVRLWFAVGNYSGFQQPRNFAFSIETVDMLSVQNITTYQTACYDNIFVTSGSVLYICLVRTSETDDTFISAIELRRLQDGMYGHAKPGTMLTAVLRYDVGGIKALRYPDDKFDRIWFLPSFISGSSDSVMKVISTNNTKDLPPTAVLQTAWVNSSDRFPFPSWSKSTGWKTLLVLYFAEIETLNISESRSFYVTIDGVIRSETITLVPNYSALQVTILSDTPPDHFELVKATNSTLRPLINAYESFWLADTALATYSQDIDALDAMKRRFDIKDWISDPCYLIPWDGIGCDNTSSAIRISEMDLSGRNLTGSVPNNIAQFTALVNLSLDHNHLTGSMPNLTNLTMLERLYLQNNSLSGTVDWLSELKNLKELNIENNNFSGVIPLPLFLNCSLKLKYSGNPYLLMNKRECSLHDLKNQNKNKLKVVLPITLSGILIISLALMVGIVVYRKRFWRKEEGVAIERSGLKIKPFFDQGFAEYSMIMVPNPTKSRSFTLDEMIAATQSFSREIGRGGFGSVYFGKLPEGNVIAVKVLSLFSRQGAQEFLNEVIPRYYYVICSSILYLICSTYLSFGCTLTIIYVSHEHVDLLSKIHHRNLVSLLGYCNETREVMLIYEHMSGGSLRDHLYGPNAENSQLNWKGRLKIALDAGQGLEYLHMGCTPKIIHRDIKTSNILIDSDSNGKLADFGLSRMTIDGEATHVTTVVKGTFGYLDPEYSNTQKLTEKSDVYSFGVVLLEIICGRKPIDLSLPEEELNIVRWVTPFLAEMDENCGKIIEIIDKRLGGDYNMKSMIRVAKIAMRCVQALPSSRPSVCEVVAELKEAIKHQDKDSISISEGMDLMVGPVDSSKRKGWEWSGNSSNISNEGR